MKKIKNIIYRIANNIITKTNWYNNVFWKGTTKFWNIKSCDYQIANLGSNSGKYAFNYDNLPIKGQNWAIGPQSLVHDFNILKNYFSYLKEGAVVLIPLCPFSCLHSPYNKESNFKYYPILHPATIIGFDDAERTRAYKIRSNPFKEMPLYCIKNTLRESLQKISHKIRRAPKMDFEKNAEMWVNLWKKQFGIEDLNAPLSEQHILERTNRANTLREIIIFCKERSLKPYIVLPPMHTALSSSLSASFKKAYVYDFIVEATDGEDILLDYIDNDFSKEDMYFMNSYFLNNKGAAMFTRKVLADINMI